MRSPGKVSVQMDSQEFNGADGCALDYLYSCIVRD